MKILYISHSPHLNGAQKSLAEYVVKVKDKGVEPIVVVPREGNLKKELDKNRIKTIIISYYQCTYKDTYGFIEYIKYMWINIRAVLKIQKLIQKEQIDIVHTNNLTVDVGAMAAYIAKVPHVWHFREYLEEHYGFKLLNFKMIKKLIKKSECCIAVSEGIRKKYQNKYGVHVICLYNGIENSRYEYPLDTQYDHNKTAKLLISGSICEEKGQWDAIRAVSILADRGIKLHLNIVGDGSSVFMEKLIRYIKEKGLKEYIAFKPYTRNLQELRIQSRIVLTCSKMESFGRATAEAMMAGKIVIGTNTGGTVELIGSNEERGYLYQYSNAKELADKIQYVLNNDAEVLQKEKEAQKFILELTDIDKYTDRVIQIYMEILEKRR